MKIQVVACSLGTDEYGIEIKHVQEIIRLLEITRVPHAPHFIEGVINLRGMIIPVLDLRTLFRKSIREDTEATRIIVVNYEGVFLGIIVDGVSEVVTLSRGQVEPPPSVSEAHSASYFTGVGKIGERLIELLNIEEIYRAIGVSAGNQESAG